MLYSDNSRGRTLAKDPAVVNFKGKYFMYYSIGPYEDNRSEDGWAIGIAESSDLMSWIKIGEILPQKEYEKKGICAPGAITLEGKVHLFYQTYGNGKKDALCHAVSEDGITFKRNETNPIFSPKGNWNCGRAIDADVIVHKNQLMLYFATRDPEFKIQMLGVASAPLNSDFSKTSWTQLSDFPILKPELYWEQYCIEAPALCKHNDKLFMFYAGAYNNCPQQIGCAISEDGIKWDRIFEEPLLPNGKPGEWNSSESGHPFLFTDEDGEMYLFFQGNNDNGHSWYLSMLKVQWSGDTPTLIR